MTRKWVDCREFPGDVACTLYMSGEEEDVVRAVTEHAASVHGEQLTPEQIRGMLKDEVEEVGMAGSWDGRRSQGDTLYEMHRIATSSDADALEWLRDDLARLVDHYRRVLEREGIPLPWSE